MKSMLLSFIFSSLLYVNLFADGCCSSCNSCKKPTHTDSGKYKTGLPLIITNDDNIKLNNNVIQPIDDGDIRNKIASYDYNITFYKLTEEQFNSSITPTVNLGNDTQYIIAKIETIEKKYYLLKIIEENHIFEADKVFYSDSYSIVTEIIILDSSENITSLERIFDQCKELKYVDLSNLNTQNVTNMSMMFFQCENLTKIDGLSSLKTQNVTNMYEMFQDCIKLTHIDLSKFNTQKVTNMNSMFYNCGSLTNLDLLSFDTQKVVNMEHIFGLCNSLKEIYVSHENNNGLLDALNGEFGENNYNYDKETKCIIIKESK